MGDDVIGNARLAYFEGVQLALCAEGIEMLDYRSGQVNNSNSDSSNSNYNVHSRKWVLLDLPPACSTWIKATFREYSEHKDKQQALLLGREALRDCMHMKWSMDGKVILLWTPSNPYSNEKKKDIWDRVAVLHNADCLLLPPEYLEMSNFSEDGSNSTRINKDSNLRLDLVQRPGSVGLFLRFEDLVKDSKEGERLAVISAAFHPYPRGLLDVDQGKSYSNYVVCLVAHGEQGAKTARDMKYKLLMLATPFNMPDAAANEEVNVNTDDVEIVRSGSSLTIFDLSVIDKMLSYDEYRDRVTFRFGPRGHKDFDGSVLLVASDEPGNRKAKSRAGLGTDNKFVSQKVFFIANVYPNPNPYPTNNLANSPSSSSEAAAASGGGSVVSISITNALSAPSPCIYGPLTVSLDLIGMPASMLTFSDILILKEDSSPSISSKRSNSSNSIYLALIDNIGVAPSRVGEDQGGFKKQVYVAMLTLSNHKGNAAPLITVLENIAIDIPRPPESFHILNDESVDSPYTFYVYGAGLSSFSRINCSGWIRELLLIDFNNLPSQQQQLFSGINSHALTMRLEENRGIYGMMSLSCQYIGNKLAVNLREFRENKDNKTSSITSFTAAIRSNEKEVYHIDMFVEGKSKHVKSKKTSVEQNVSITSNAQFVGKKIPCGLGLDLVTNWNKTMNDYMEEAKKQVNEVLRLHEEESKSVLKEADAVEAPNEINLYKEKLGQIKSRRAAATSSGTTNTSNREHDELALMQEMYSLIGKCDMALPNPNTTSSTTSSSSQSSLLGAGISGSSKMTNAEYLFQEMTKYEIERHEHLANVDKFIGRLKKVSKKINNKITTLHESCIQDNSNSQLLSFMQRHKWQNNNSIAQLSEAKYRLEELQKLLSDYKKNGPKRESSLVAALPLAANQLEFVNEFEYKLSFPELGSSSSASSSSSSSSSIFRVRHPPAGSSSSSSSSRVAALADGDTDLWKEKEGEFMGKIGAFIQSKIKPETFNERDYVYFMKTNGRSSWRYLVKIDDFDGDLSLNLFVEKNMKSAKQAGTIKHLMAKRSSSKTSAASHHLQSYMIAVWTKNAIFWPRQSLKCIVAPPESNPNNNYNPNPNPNPNLLDQVVNNFPEYRRLNRKYAGGDYTSALSSNDNNNSSSNTEQIQKNLEDSYFRCVIFGLIEGIIAEKRVYSDKLRKGECVLRSLCDIIAHMSARDKGTQDDFRRKDPYIDDVVKKLRNTIDYIEASIKGGSSTVAELAQMASTKRAWVDAADFEQDFLHNPRLDAVLVKFCRYVTAKWLDYFYKFPGQPAHNPDRAMFGNDRLVGALSRVWEREGALPAALFCTSKIIDLDVGKEISHKQWQIKLGQKCIAAVALDKFYEPQDIPNGCIWRYFDACFKTQLPDGISNPVQVEIDSRKFTVIYRVREEGEGFGAHADRQLDASCGLYELNHSSTTIANATANVSGSGGSSSSEYVRVDDGGKLSIDAKNNRNKDAKLKTFDISGRELITLNRDQAYYEKWKRGGAFRGYDVKERLAVIDVLDSYLQFVSLNEEKLGDKSKTIHINGLLCEDVRANGSYTLAAPESKYKYTSSVHKGLTLEYVETEGCISQLLMLEKEDDIGTVVLARSACGRSAEGVERGGGSSSMIELGHCYDLLYSRTVEQRTNGQ